MIEDAKIMFTGYKHTHNIIIIQGERQITTPEEMNDNLILHISPKLFT